VASPLDAVTGVGASSQPCLVVDDAAALLSAISCAGTGALPPPPCVLEELQRNTATQAERRAAPSSASH
jgi:hypothetical protein